MTSRGQNIQHIALAPAQVFGSEAAKGDIAVATRFAPSPNGALHLGHAYAAIAAHDFARAADGKFMLRIENIDGTRSKAEHIDGILADLRWMGLSWDGVEIYQSERIKSYKAALKLLQEMELIYPCICSRRDIAEALKLRHVRHGPDGPQYPGSCRGKTVDLDKPHSWRLDMAKSCEIAGPLSWHDMAAGDQAADPDIFGDIVLWRKDAPASYHLAATLDDAADNISHVVRGMDLFAYSGLHRLLQKLLNLPEPTYWHHGLILDDDGEKLAKSRQSTSLSSLRMAGEDGPSLAATLRKAELPLGTVPGNL